MINNQNSKEYIKKQLSMNKSTDTEIEREELLGIIESYGLQIEGEPTKKSLVHILFDSDQVENFLSTYSHRFLVPAFTLAKFYSMTTPQFNLLSDAGVIEEPYIVKTLTSNNIGGFDTRCYEVTALDKYNQEELLKHLVELERYDIGIRLEVNDEKLVNPVMNKIKNTFDNVSEPNLFPAGSGSNKKKSLYIYLYAKTKEESQ